MGQFISAPFFRYNTNKNNKIMISFYFELVARDDLYCILTSLYQDSTKVARLNRKYNKYQEFLQWYIKKGGSLAQ